MTKGIFLGSLLARMQFGGLLTWRSNPSIRIVYWHLHPYFPCKFSPIMLQVEAWELCFLGYFGSRLPGWRGSATEMLSHGIAKVEEEQTVFFPCPLAVVVSWWVGLPDVQMCLVAISPMLELGAAEKRLHGLIWGHGSLLSFCVHKPETYAARPDFCSSSLSNSFMAPS